MLAEREGVIEAWLDRQRVDNPVLAAIDRDPQLRRWYVRLRGEERDFIAVWFTLGEYTLQHETYFMPAPEEREQELYEFLLRRNHRLFGMHFAIGGENAIYLVGHLPIGSIDDAELDRVLGSAYAYVEQWFRPAMRIGYASKFRG